jgi:hypothetical protein
MAKDKETQIPQVGGMTKRLNIPMYLQDDANKTDSEKAWGFNEDSDKLHMARPWIDAEYEKHIAGLRARYPMLMSLMLRGPAVNNANLSDIATTNKYARLADAYNAKLRLADIGVTSGFDTYSVGAPRYEQVPRLETQDQKQMDQLRQAQAAMRQHQLSEESHFQRDVWKRKGDEVQKLVNEEYERQFWQKTEQRRRISAQFDSWSRMNEQEFAQVLTQLGIPEAKAAHALSLLRSGQYLDYAQFLNAHNLKPMAIDQIYMYSVSADIVKRLASKDIDYKTAAREIGKFPAAFAIQSITGFVTEAENDKDPDIAAAGRAARAILGNAAQFAKDASKHLTAILVGLIGSHLIGPLANAGIKIGTAIAGGGS